MTALKLSDIGGLLKEELPQGRSVTNSDTLSLNKIGISRNQSSVERQERRVSNVDTLEKIKFLYGT